MADELVNELNRKARDRHYGLRKLVADNELDVVVVTVVVVVVE